MANRWENNGNKDRLYFLGLKNHCRWWLQAWHFSLEEKLWQTCCCCCVASIMSDSVQPHRRPPTRLLSPWGSPGKNTGVGCHFLLHDKPRQCIKKQRHHFADKGPYSQSCSFPCSHVRMWELDHKEGWEPKNWCFWTVVLEKTLESPLDSNEIKLVNPKGYQSWIFFGRTEAEAEAPILCPPVAKSRLIRKNPHAGKDWRQKEEGTTEDEVVAWHHRLIGHEFE